MLYTKLALFAAFSALTLAEPEASAVQVRQTKKAATGTGNNAAANNNAGGLALAAAAVQTGSASDGQGAIGSDATQAASSTSTNNFINFCSGKLLTNGLQQIQGSCNGIGM